MRNDIKKEFEKLGYYCVIINDSLMVHKRAWWQEYSKLYETNIDFKYWETRVNLGLEDRKSVVNYLLSVIKTGMKINKVEEYREEDIEWL